MRKIALLLIILAGLSQAGKAQWPSLVHDPLSYGELGLILEKGVEQGVKLEQQISFLQDAKEALTVVSKVFKGLNTVEKALDISRATITQINSVQSRIKGMKGDPIYITASANYCMRQLNLATDNITHLTSILTDNALRLDDSERLNQVQQTMAEMGNISNRVNRTLRQIDRIEKKSNALKCF